MAITFGIATGVGAAAAGASGLLAVGVGFAAAAAYDYVIDSIVENIKADTMSGRNASAKNSVSSRKVVYGTARLGGSIIHQVSSGNDNIALHTVFAVCEGEIQNIKTVYADDKVLATATGGNNPSHSFYNENWTLGPDYINKVVDSNDIVIRSFTGIENQNAVQTGIPDWTGNPKCHGVCYVYVRLAYRSELFPNGFPNISFLVRGKKVYNPTYDSTKVGTWRSSGATTTDTHRENDPDTWEYSHNPAICLIDYLRNEKYGVGIPLSDIDYVKGKEAINNCALTDSDWFSSGADGLNQIYRCDGVVDTVQSHKNNISAMLTSMNGKLTYTAGKYNIIPYTYTAPESADVIDEDMILGSIDLVTKQSRKSSYNRVKGQFVSKEDNYVLTDYPQQLSAYVGNASDDNTVYDLADGEKLYLEQNYPFTTSHEHAQYLSRLTLLRSRMQATAKFTTNIKGLKYQVGDNIKFSNSVLGYTDKIFEILRMNIKASTTNGITIDFEVKENASAIYDPDSSTLQSYTTGVAVSNWDGTVPDPTGLNLLPYADSGVNKIQASWTAPAQQGVLRYEVTFDPQSDGKDIYSFNTYDTSYTYDVPTEYANRVYSVTVKAHSEVHLTTSDGVNDTVQATNAFVDNIENVVTGTDATPTQDELNTLARQAGFTLTDGLEIRYQVVDSSGEVINVIDYRYNDTKFHYDQLVLNQIVTATPSTEYLENGDFSTTANWTINNSSIAITNNSLVFTSATIQHAAYAFTKYLTPNKEYSVTFTVSNVTEPVVFATYNADQSALNAYAEYGAGTHTVTFTPVNDRVIIAFSGSTNNATCTVDNVTVKEVGASGVATADQHMRVYLPADINATWSFTKTNVTGMSDSGVVSTESHFPNGATHADGREYIELRLQRPSSAGVGVSKATYVVEAEYPATISDADGGTISINKKVYQELVFYCEVVA